MIKARTGIPELRGPALVCLSAIDKKSVSICIVYNFIGLTYGLES